MDTADDTNVPLFDPPPPRRRTLHFPRGATVCYQAGQRGRWKQWALHAHPYLADRVPVCDRLPGHEGPHRTYDANGRIRAEWE